MAKIIVEVPDNFTSLPISLILRELSHCVSSSLVSGEQFRLYWSPADSDKDVEL